MSCGNSSVEVRAALGVLHEGFRATDLLDLATRVAALEEQDADIIQET